jgi:hypothetical protein
LQLVSDVLNDNTEAVLKNLIIDQITSNVIPSIRSAVDKTVTDQLNDNANAQLNAIQKELARLVPGAVSQSLQKPETVKSISDKVSYNVNIHVEDQIASAVNNLAPNIAKITAHTVSQRIGEDVGVQLSDALARIEDHRREDNEKFERLLAQTKDLSSAISTLAASQSQVQSDLASLKQQLHEQSRDREHREREHRERELPPQEPTHARGHPVPVNTVQHNPAPQVPRELVSYPHQVEHQPQHLQQHSHAQMHQQRPFAAREQQPQQSQPQQQPQQVFAPTNRDRLERRTCPTASVVRWCHYHQ